MTMTQAKPQESQPLYAIVELFGHQRIAGCISEQTFGGASFVRVDVPEVSCSSWKWDDQKGEQIQVTHHIQAHTKSFGAAAIYAIQWCDEAAALMAAREIQHKPISPYQAADVLKAMKPDEVKKLLMGGTRDIEFDSNF